MPEMDYSKNSPFSLREGEWLDNAPDLSNAILAGEETCPRNHASSYWGALATGHIRLTYFTARVSEVITKVKLITGDTAAAATPTAIRVGIYKVEDNDDLTLVASIPSDLTLFAATYTIYERVLSASFNKVSGQRYAVGVFITTAFIAPTFYGPTAIHADAMAMAPRLCGTYAAASLVSTIPAASITNIGVQVYAQLLR